MNHNTKNIIEELDRLVSERDKHQIVEARANNIIVSAINLIQLVNESFETDEADELNRRLITAIKNKDPQRFNRKIREYRKINEKRNRDVKR